MSPSLGKGVVVGLKMGSPGGDFLYFPHSNIGLSPFLQCSDLSRTDGRTDAIGLAKGGTMLFTMHYSASAAKKM